MTALVPVWSIALGRAFWRRSWLAGFLVFNLGMLLKVIWSFYIGGSSALSINPAVSLGALVINGIMLYAYRRARRRPANSLSPAA
jgi:glycerol uptake facilitator-like aquaporin